MIVAGADRLPVQSIGTGSPLGTPTISSLRSLLVVLRAAVEELQRQRTRVGEDPQLHRLAGKVRAAQERRLDAEHADDGCLLLGDRGRALAAEDRRAGSLRAIVSRIT